MFKTTQTKCIAAVLLAIAIAIYLLLYLSWQESNTVRIFRLPHTMPSDHPVHLAMVKMASRLDELSKGKMKIQIYPSGLLGDGVQIKELMQLNVVDIGKFSASDFEDNIPEMAAFCMPYLFTDSTHYWKVLSSPLGDQILNAGYASKAQVKGLCYYDAGARSFYSTTRVGPLTSTAQLKGRKIRVMVSALMVAGVEAIGAVPTSMAWGELFTALQTGTVDAAENNIPSYYTSRHYETAPILSLSEHFRTPDILMMNRQSWDALNSKEQSMLLQAAQESALYQRDIWDKATNDYLEEMKKAGVTVHDVDIKAMHSAVKPLYDQLEKSAKNNTRNAQIFKTIQAIQEVK